MKPLSAKIAGVTESATIAISNKAKAMQRQGIDVISLSIGEPDFATPQHITDACIDALKRGETHYAPSNGIPELMGAIAEKIVIFSNLIHQALAFFRRIWPKHRFGIRVSAAFEGHDINPDFIDQSR